MLKALVKKQLLELTAPLRRSSATGRRRTGWKAAAFGVLVVCLFGLVMGSVGVLDALICPPLTAAGLDWLYFALSAAPALLVGVLGGGMMAYSSLYAARDNEMLLSLPIPPGMILGVRMGYVWFLGLGYQALVLAPAYGVYFVLGSRPVAAALAMAPVLASLGCLVLAVSCLAGWAAAMLGGRITRYKAALNLLYAVAVLALALGANVGVRQGLTWLLTHLDQVQTLGGSAWLVYLLGSAAAGEGWAVGLLAAAGLGALALCWLVLRRNYLRIMTTRRAGARPAYREKPARAHSVRRALLGREWLRLAGSTSYMVNSTMASILMVLAVPVLIWKAEDLRALLALWPQAGAYGPAAGCGLVCSVAAMSLITPPSVSLEGRTLWLIQSLPVTPWQALRAKLDLHLVLTLPPALAAAGCVVWLLGCDPLSAGLVLAETALFTLLTGAAGLVLGLRLPNLHWTNETAAVKNSAAPVVTLFGGWAALVALAGLWWVTRGLLGPAGALAACCAVTAAGCIGLLHLLRRWGTAAFAGL